MKVSLRVDFPLKFIPIVGRNFHLRIAYCLCVTVVGDLPLSVRRKEARLSYVQSCDCRN